MVLLQRGCDLLPLAKRGGYNVLQIKEISFRAQPIYSCRSFKSPWRFLSIDALIQVMQVSKLQGSSRQIYLALWTEAAETSSNGVGSDMDMSPKDMDDRYFHMDRHLGSTHENTEIDDDRESFVDEFYENEADNEYFYNKCAGDHDAAADMSMDFEDFDPNELYGQPWDGDRY